MKKRILSMVTMLCLLLALFVNENSIIAYAASSSQTESGCVSVQFGSTPVSNIQELNGMVEGHDLDLKLKITSNDGEQTKDIITLEDNSMNNIVYDSTYTYTYTLTSENYDLVLAGDDGMTYLQNAKGFTFDENKKFTLVIEKVIPKYTFTMSPTITNPLAQGSSTEFSVHIIPESWNDQIVTWTVLGGSEYVSITTDNNKCIVTVNDSLHSEDLELVLNAFAPNRQQMSKSIKLGKTPVALSVESQTGDWDAITITAATNPVLSDVELKLVVPSSVEGEQRTVYTATTNKDGKAVFTVALIEDSTLNYQIEYAGNNTYKSAVTASQSYTPTKKTPVLTLASSDNANACGSEIKIGTISSSVVGDQKQLFSSEAITDGKQNGTVRIDENGYVYYTPATSGTAVIKITREEDAKYNAVFVSTTVSVVKKNATIHIGGTEVRNAKDAICTEDGYTGDTYCLGCGAKLSDGVPITKLGHIDDNKNHECDRENCKATISSHIGGTATCKDKAVCSVCGEEYGEADATNHTTFIHTEAKAATVTETGNTEYWYCEDCGKYFSDKDGKNVIDLKDTVIKKLPPEIIDGKEQTFTAGEARELTFRSNAAYSDFIRVEIDGQTIDGKNYTVKEGSTVVTLNAAYTATLSAGRHTLSIVSENGIATTTFTVYAKAGKTITSPITGDNSRVALMLSLLLVSGGALAGIIVFGKKKKHLVK